MGSTTSGIYALSCLSSSMASAGQATSKFASVFGNIAQKVAAASIGANIVPVVPMSAPSGQMFYMDSAPLSISDIPYSGKNISGSGRICGKYVMWVDSRFNPGESPYPGIIKRDYLDEIGGNMPVVWVKNFQGMIVALERYGMPYCIYFNSMLNNTDRNEEDSLLYIISVYRQYPQLGMPQIKAKGRDNAKNEKLISIYTSFINFQKEKQKEV